MRSSFNIRRVLQSLTVMLVILPAAYFAAPTGKIGITIENGSGGLGVIKGVVRDEGGSPIADATVAIFKGGTSTLLKQVS
ncbi:MAG: hypothetical protein JO053_14320, partial [Acidobacteria bacterium]|nr:hypothetical protein [Acidobacteriota bacterium]